MAQRWGFSGGRAISSHSSLVGPQSICLPFFPPFRAEGIASASYRIEKLTHPRNWQKKIRKQKVGEKLAIFIPNRIVPFWPTFSHFRMIFLYFWVFLCCQPNTRNWIRTRSMHVGLQPQPCWRKQCICSRLAKQALTPVGAAVAIGYQQVGSRVGHSCCEGVAERNCGSAPKSAFWVLFGVFFGPLALL